MTGERIFLSLNEAGSIPLIKEVRMVYATFTTAQAQVFGDVWDVAPSLIPSRCSPTVITIFTDSVWNVNTPEAGCAWDRINCLMLS